VETPDTFDVEPEETSERGLPAPAPDAYARPVSFSGLGDRIAWIAGLVLLLSSFMAWYSGTSIEGPTLAVIGWHTGTIGKLVFFIGLAVVVLAVLREVGVQLPPAVPESLVTIVLGALATILIIVRLISIPDTFAGTSGRAIGIWIGLLSAIAVIVGGLLRAAEDL
jgi:hypothetical protein